MSPLVPGSRLRMSSLQLRVNVGAPFLVDSEAVSWDDSCFEDFQWWSFASHLMVGLPLGLPQPGISLFTDASDTGWDASLGDNHMSGLWNHDCSNFSINHRELLVVLYMVQGLLPLFRGRLVSLFVDDTTFIPGRLNVLADSLSCHSQVLGSDWTLCHQAFREVLHHCPATVDLFAMNMNHRFPVYFSPMPDPQSAGTDAMMQSWDDLQVYAFPPFRLLQRVLS